MRHILLTGATGFLGSHLLEAFLTEGYQVTIIKRSTSETWRIDHLMAQVRAWDVDKFELQEAFKTKKVDIVVHTACAYGRDNESTCSILNTNLIFGVKLLETSIEYGVEKFINTDTFFSGKTISNHLLDYSLSKKQFTEWLKSKSNEVKSINLRLQHVYGPKDNSKKFIPWLIDKITNTDGRVPLTSGEQQRDFVYVNDVVSAYITAINHKLNGTSFLELNVGTGVKTNLRYLVETIYKDINKRRPVKSYLGFGDIEKNVKEIEEVDCDIRGLKNIGWTPKYNIVNGVSDMLSREGY